MKKILLFVFGFMFLPHFINAEQVSYNVTGTCQSNFNYKFVYDNPKTYVCSNGNSSPYTRTIQDTCKSLTQSACNIGTVKRCSVTLDYDCSRLTSGAKFTTTTKRTTKKRTNTTTTSTTTVPVKSNTKLKSLSLSSGVIDFNSEKYEYSIKIEATVNSIDITAIPEDETSRVEIKNNTNIVNGSVISILVTGTDNSTSEYKINVVKDDYIMSSNAKLRSLNITNYPIGFNSKINEYSVTLKEGVNQLDINYEAEDEKSVVTITGNENLTKGSKIVINVTAEDGTENAYTIIIDVEKDSNILSIIFIIILILAIIAGGYYIYKKLIHGKAGEKYEYE